jgi:hypothetical protein
MKSLAEITTFYNGLLANAAALEMQRQTISKTRNIKLAKYVVIGVLPISILAYLFIPSLHSESAAGILFAGNGVLFVGALLYSGIRSMQQFKPIRIGVYNQLVKPMVEFINNQLQFNITQGLPLAELQGTGLLGRPSFRSEGLISGTINKTGVRVSEVEALAQIQSDGGKNIRFKGVYGILKTQHDFGVGLYIRPKKDHEMQTAVGGTLAKLLTGKEYGETVSTNHSLFDRNYQLSALDVSHAERFITSPLFQAIANLNNTTSANPAIFLKGHEIHIALEGTVSSAMGVTTPLDTIPVLDFSKNLNLICAVAEAC